MCIRDMLRAHPYDYCPISSFFLSWWKSTSTSYQDTSCNVTLSIKLCVSDNVCISVFILHSMLSNCIIYSLQAGGKICLEGGDYLCSIMLTFTWLPLCSKLCWHNPPRPILSTPAEAVEAIQGVVPPVLFKGCSWISTDHVASECYVIHALWRYDAHLKSRWNTTLFSCTQQELAKWF